MPELEKFWRSEPGFRTALARLLYVPRDRFERISRAVAKGLDPDVDVLEDNDLDPDEAGPLIAVMRTLYHMAHHEDGLDVVLQDLERIGARYDETRPAPPREVSVESLRPLLVQRLEFEEREFRSSVQHARSPVLEGLRFGLDGRASQYNGVEQTVPVTWVEMVFDVPVGGSSVVSADIPDEVLTVLTRELEDLKRTRAKWDERMATKKEEAAAPQQARIRDRAAELQSASVEEEE